MDKDTLVAVLATKTGQVNLYAHNVMQKNGYISKQIVFEEAMFPLYGTKDITYAPAIEALENKGTYVTGIDGRVANITSKF